MKMQRKGNLYVAYFKGSQYLGNLRDCLLFAMGYGADQAAELRFLLRR